MVEDVYETVEDHAAHIGAFHETVEGFAHWLDQYDAAKQGETVFSADDVEEEIAAHYAAFPKRKSTARETMVDLLALENRVRNAANQGLAYDDLPADEDDLDALLDDIEAVKEEYYAARDVGAAAVETVEEDFGGAELLIDDDWYAGDEGSAERDGRYRRLEEPEHRVGYRW